MARRENIVKFNEKRDRNRLTKAERKEDYKKRKNRQNRNYQWSA